MIWLEAILAFAITMMALSTMVSMIVETLHRIFGVREKGLRLMIEQVFNDIIWPKLAFGQNIPGSRGTLHKKEDIAKKFITFFSSARFAPISENESWHKKIVSFFLRGKQLKSLSTLEFIERLGETEAGRRLIEDASRRSKDYLDTIISDIANKYEDFGENVRDYFSRRARLISVVVSIVLAVCINFDAVTVFKTYLAKHSVRSAIFEKGEAISEQLQLQEKELNDLANSQVLDDPKVLEEIKKNQQGLNKLYDDLVAEGVPIGWVHAPFNTDKARWGKMTPWEQSITLVGWLLSVLLGGFLIGLGGPFWYDLYKRLSMFTSVVRGLQSTVQKPKDQIVQKAAEGLSAEPAEVFHTAAIAKFAEIPQGRTLLLPDGTAYTGG